MRNPARRLLTNHFELLVRLERRSQNRQRLPNRVQLRPPGAPYRHNEFRHDEKLSRLDCTIALSTAVFASRVRSGCSEKFSSPPPKGIPDPRTPASIR